MADFKTGFCGLCLTDIADDNFTVIEECTKDMLDLLLLKLDSDNSSDVLCSNCMEKLFAAYNFKTTCLHTENIIKTHVYSEDVLPLDINDIYMKEIENKQLANTFEDHKVCRFCMELIQGELKSVKDIDPMILQNYIPEMNFDYTRDPVICKQCFDLFFIHVAFIEKCASKQQMLIDNNESVEAVLVKNEDVKIETSEDIKMDTEAIKTEEVIIKPDECESTSRAPKIYKSNPILGTQVISNFPIYSCEKCDYQTKVKRNIARHSLVHKDPSEIEMFKCPECEYQTKYRYTLATHQVKHRTPSELKMFKCQQCDYQTKYKSTLTAHELKHKDASEVKMYKCKQCDFKTRYKADLTTHRLKHKDISEVKAYQCNECPFQTKYRCGLIRHQLKHKDASEIKMHKCERCPYETRYKTDLTHHELSHKDATETTMYKCPECEHQTKYKYDLYRHRLIHKDVSEVVMYNCPDCEYQTKFRRNLISHQIMHKNESEVVMYKCDRCDYKSKYKQHVTKHCLKHKVMSETETDKKP